MSVKINPVQAILASIAILTTAMLAEVLAPRELMASASSSIKLENVVPQQFGQWKAIPNVGLVTPAEPEGVGETRAQLAAKIYSQELGRGYSDGNGHVAMLLIAYGPVQNFRLKSHRPEVCYTAAGFRVSNKSNGELLLQNKEAP